MRQHITSNDEEHEMADRSIRLRNVIVRGLEETRVPDEMRIKEVLGRIGVDPDIISVARIGIKSNGRSRPVRVQFESEKVREAVMVNKNKLKDDIVFAGVRIDEDLTKKQRNNLERKFAEVQMENEKLPSESPSLWIVAGRRSNPYLKLVSKR